MGTRASRVATNLQRHPALFQVGYLFLSFLVNELRRFRKHPEGMERECFPFRKRCGLYLSNSRLIFGLIRRGPEDASMNIHVKAQARN